MLEFVGLDSIDALWFSRRLWKAISGRPHSMTPSHPPRRLVIATRQSALAMWQARHIQSRLETLYPRASIELLGLTTQGDRIVDRALSAIGGKGLFIKELEVAMSDGRADLAVHSLKDVPMDVAEGFVLAAIAAREDPRDAFVSTRYASMASLPAHAKVGTSSLRREAQIRERHPALDVQALRGNVNKRLKKLDEGRYDAIILAAAGLKRLGFGDRIRDLLDPADCLPAPGQGALGIEIKSADAETAALLAPFDDVATRAATAAERGVSRGLGGSCQMPLAAYAEVEGGTLRLRALVGNAKTGAYVETEVRGPLSDPEALASRAVEQLTALGALQLLGSA